MNLYKKWDFLHKLLGKIIPDEKLNFASVFWNLEISKKCFRS